jgi:hypothetical protein
MDAISDNDITVISTGIASDMFNIICGIRTKNTLHSAVEKFRNEKLPFACWIGFQKLKDC